MNEERDVREKAKAEPGDGEEKKETEVPEDTEDVSDEVSEIERLQEEVTRLNDRWLRAVADLDNYRKRTAREREREMWRVRAGTTLPLLDVLDDFGRAIEQESSGEDSLRRGVTLIREKFVAALAGIGVEPFPSIGEPFDPDRHDALQQLATDEYPEGHVAAEIRTGYLCDGKVLRPATVAVAIPPIDESKTKNLEE